MFNKKEFRRAIEDAGYTLDDIAQKLNINKTTLWRKINGKSDFYRNEIQIIADLIGFEKVKLIFFSTKVA